MRIHEMGGAELQTNAARAIGNLHSAEQEHVVALDGLAIAVHPENRVAQISLGRARRLCADDPTLELLFVTDLGMSDRGHWPLFP